jgi:hypothetical protein
MEELYALRRYIETGDTTAALALLDELDEMSKDDKIQKIVSFMRMLLVHMIKQAVEHRTTKSWEASIRHALKQIVAVNTRLLAAACKRLIMYEAPSPAYLLVCYSRTWERGEKESAWHAPPSLLYGASRQRFPCAAPLSSLARTGERYPFSHPFA